MNRISISRAWASAIDFLRDHLRAILLLVVGSIVLTGLLQVAIYGTMTAPNIFDPAMMSGDDPAAMMAAFSFGAIVIAVAVQVIQTATYFASWRVGLVPDGRMGEAIVYGLIAAITTLLLAAIAGFIIALMLALVFGGMAAGMMGADTPGGVAGVGMTMILVFPVMLFLMLWLAARLSCTGPAMSAVGGYNPLSGIVASWRMTAASQWKIMGYLLILFIVVLVVASIFVGIFGVTMLAGGFSGASIAAGVVGAFLLGIPSSLLSIAVPAGLYRELADDRASDIFA